MNMFQILQKQEVISIRDFMRRLSEITEKPTSPVYTITKNGKKVGTYIPEKNESEIFNEIPLLEEDEKIYTSVFDRYDEIKFEGGPPDLSMRIDEMLYGKNPDENTK